MNASLSMFSQQDHQLILDFLQRSSVISTKEEFTALFQDIHKIVPHEFSACGLIDIQSLRFEPIYSRYTVEFAAEYIIQGFPTEPSLIHLQKGNCRFATSDDEPDLDRGSILEEVKARHGVRNCFSAASGKPDDIIFYMAFSNFDETYHEKLRTVVSLLGTSFYFSSIAVASPWPTQHAGFPVKTLVGELTEREREVLNWVIQGKTNWEIGMILGISERTVRFHLEAISSKAHSNPRAWDPDTRQRIERALALKGHPDTPNQQLKTVTTSASA